MEENKENVVEKTTDKNVTKVNLKKKQEETITKVDMTKPIKPKENEVKENSSDETGVVEDVKSEDTGSTQEQKEIQQEAETQEQPALEEVTEEEQEQKVEQQAEELVEETKEAIAEAQETGKELPENIQKLVDFINETGGNVEDYVRLNQDYSGLDEHQLLKEYYKNTKSHLSDDEINFIIEEEFMVDEDLDDEKVAKKKKIALKEQVASAKSHLDGLKSKYYEEIKAGSKLTSEQQKAVEFFNRYNKESEETQKIAEKQKSTFLQKTEQVFSNDFKGFDYQVGEKKFRFNVKDSAKVKDTQSNINNFVKKFLNENNEMNDAAGYHKGLFTAMNPDAVAKHFYEQGKADAMKESMAKAKNVDMNPRQQHGNVIETGGLKVRAVTGDDSSRLRVKMRK